MTEKYAKEQSALAQALIENWNDKYNEMERLRAEMKEIQQKMVETFPRFKVGDVFREVATGKRHVVTKIKVNDWSLRGQYGKGPQLEFEYSTRPIRKDGQPSLNSSSIWGSPDVEPTGEHFDIE